jgi:formylglycine-generating enzyme
MTRTLHRTSSILVGFALIATNATAQDRVALGRFAIDTTEVPVGAFRTFVRARNLTTAAEKAGGGFEYVGGWQRRAGWSWSSPQGKPAVDAEPVTHVTWSEARDYCAFVGGRLPTRAEWREAAFTERRETPTDGFVRGRTYTYPVGDASDGMNNSRKAHVPVATTKRGVNGLYDMGANVWEWLADRQGNEALTAGGSWWYGPEQTRADAPQWKAADFTAVYIGFRCAYDLKS